MATQNQCQQHHLSFPLSVRVPFLDSRSPHVVLPDVESCLGQDAFIIVAAEAFKVKEEP